MNGCFQVKVSVDIAIKWIVFCLWQEASFSCSTVSILQFVYVFMHCHNVFKCLPQFCFDSPPHYWQYCAVFVFVCFWLGYYILHFQICVCVCVKKWCATCRFSFSNFANGLPFCQLLCFKTANCTCVCVFLLSFGKQWWWWQSIVAWCLFGH